MHTVSFVYFLLFTWPCDWRYYAYYLIFIEFTSRFAGEVYPHARIEQRIYKKSPESVFKRVTQKNNANSERMWAYDKRKTDELCEIRARTAKVNQNWFTILDQNRKSESHLIHSHISPKRALCGADATRSTLIRNSRNTRRLARLWSCGAARAVQLNTRE